MTKLKNLFYFQSNQRYHKSMYFSSKTTIDVKKQTF